MQDLRLISFISFLFSSFSKYRGFYFSHFLFFLSYLVLYVLNPDLFRFSSRFYYFLQFLQRHLVKTLLSSRYFTKNLGSFFLRKKMLRPFQENLIVKKITKIKKQKV